LNVYRHFLSVKFLESDWYNVLKGRACKGKFDIIVANPPYLTPQEFASAQDEVRKYESIASLVGGDGGLRDIEIILRRARNFLKKEGLVALETEIPHSRQLRNKSKHFFNKMEIMRDLNQLNRFFVAHI
jgi:release factor glutamine methyltransferase